ncbi:MAG: hypothetical protein ABL949_08715 [Fimbriimonadaceae bacterium]
MKKLILPMAVCAAAFAFSYGINSGLDKGESVTPFHPTHIVGPFAGKTECFPCNYQNRPQVQAWINGDSAKNVAMIGKTLEAAMAANTASEFKAMIVLVTADAKGGASMAKELAKENNLSKIAISVLNPKDAAVKSYKFNTASDVKNTVFVYKNWKVVDKFVNLNADDKGTKALKSAISGITAH